MTISTPTAKCPKCGVYIPIWKLGKNIEGKPILEFHTIPGKYKECPGSMRPFAEDGPRKWR